MAHSDGPAYCPVVSTVTTGGGQTLILVDESRKEVSRIYLEPRALNVLYDQAYSQGFYSIQILNLMFQNSIQPFLK